MNKAHNKIQWFDKLRLNSWEVEILIVGFVLVILIQVPALINFEIDKVMNSTSLDHKSNFIYALGQFLALASINISTSILTYSFSAYFIMRGFWVGVLGLSSVYPSGINIKSLNFSEKFTNEIKKYNFNDFIISVDNICSSIFSFSFLLSFLIISFLLFCFQLVLIVSPVPIYLEVLYPDGSIYESTLEVVFIVFTIFGFIYFLDLFLFSILKKIKWKPFAFCYYYIHLFYKYSTIFFIYDNLYYAFISNIKRRIMLLVLISYIILSSAFSPIDERPFFAYQNSKNIMHYSYYADQLLHIEQEDDWSYPENPFINSEVVSSNYLKLYIPYLPSLNKSIKKICVDIDDINDDYESIEDQSMLLECINQVFNIYIDDIQIESDFIFYKYSHQYINIPTYFMVVPLEDFSNGKHYVEIIVLDKDKLASDLTIEVASNDEHSVEIKVSEDTLIDRIIPFYLQKD